MIHYSVFVLPHTNYGLCEACSEFHVLARDYRGGASGMEMEIQKHEKESMGSSSSSIHMDNIGN